MIRFEIDEGWIDRYLRDELSAEEADAFELELMDSPELLQSYMAAMGVQQAVQLDSQTGSTSLAGNSGGSHSWKTWQSLAMAASVLVAIVSTTMYVDLRRESMVLRQPVGNVLTVPVKLMRSGGTQEAPRGVAIPDVGGLILLEIESTSELAAESTVEFRLLTSDRVELMSWTSVPLDSGGHNAVLRTDILPRGRVWLEAHDAEGALVYRQMLEFR